jgi:hypothetical protein
MLILSMASILLSAATVHVVYFSNVTDVTLRRVQARSDLLSLTNLALKWLKEELRTGTQWRADAVKSNEYLADSNALCIFSLEDPSMGSVKVFDLGYDPGKAAKSPADLLLFPPSYPGAYLIRAVAEKQGLASIMEESVFVLTSINVPGEGVVDILEEDPLFSREIFR